jgi:hypothetical protein
MAAAAGTGEPSLWAAGFWDLIAITVFQEHTTVALLLAQGNQACGQWQPWGLLVGVGYQEPWQLLQAQGSQDSGNGSSGACFLGVGSRRTVQ